jgi:DNA-binding response OmpR family regulator
MKKHILIVEDDVFHYNAIRELLEENRFSVADYTPGFEPALERIRRKRPDLVLLDIQLKGEKTGIELGKILKTEYDIPFIYVTESDDLHTFMEAYGTDMEDYVVKTKPVLNGDELLRAIWLFLKRRERTNNRKDGKNTIGLEVLTNYLSETKKAGINGSPDHVPVRYDEILYFSKEPEAEINGKKIKLHVNYSWVVTRDNVYYLIPKSLKKLESILPDNFVRINDKFIINIKSDDFRGSVNQIWIYVGGKKLKISSTFSSHFKDRFRKYYKPLK